MMTVPDFRSLDGRVVLITGGAGHIGATITGAFLATGCSVMTADVSELEPWPSSDPHRFQHVLVDLEAKFGKPVLTANQVTAWEGLRLTGLTVDAPGLGSLFTSPPGPPPG